MQAVPGLGYFTREILLLLPHIPQNLKGGIVLECAVLDKSYPYYKIHLLLIIFSFRSTSCGSLKEIK